MQEHNKLTRVVVGYLNLRETQLKSFTSPWLKLGHQQGVTASDSTNQDLPLTWEKGCVPEQT